MAPNAPSLLNRREVVSGLSAALAFAALRDANASTPVREFALAPQAGRARLFTADGPETAVWSYNGAVPGPEIRVRQGERLRVRVENRLSEETTVHWHGIRLPNAMDGVPHLTQKPIAPGESFVYEFDCPDAGTFWYHPHQRSHEQLGRGLSGALIVEEPVSYPADRDVTWLVGDWRLGRDGSAIDDFGGLHDISHDAVSAMLRRSTAARSSASRCAQANEFVCGSSMPRARGFRLSFCRPPATSHRARRSRSRRMKPKAAASFSVRRCGRMS